MNFDRSNVLIGAGIASSTQRANRGQIWAALMGCSALLALFALLAWLGVRGRCATFDEPLHATAVSVISQRADFRVDPENPPLWEYWAALTQPAGAVKFNTGDVSWGRMLDDNEQKWDFAARTLYRGGNDADRFLSRSHMMMILIGVALGGMIALWAWQLAGSVAAVISLLFFSLDPNFLAHAPLLKSDVCLSLDAAGLTWALWWCGRKLSWASLAAVAIFMAATLCTKLSGIILVPILVLVLVARAALPWPWRCFGRELGAISSKMLVATLIGLIAGAASFAAIWGCYHFRFAPSPDGQLFNVASLMTKTANTADLLAKTSVDELLARHPGREPNAAANGPWQPGPFIRAVLLAERHRLLPQTWLYGLLYLNGTSLFRYSFLCGRYSPFGFWDYFPLAFAFKTPLATQAALGLAILVAAAALVGKRRGKNQPRRSPSSERDRQSHASLETYWAALCLSVPVIIYGGVSLLANLDIGLRHILPIYPFLFILIGWCAARAWRWRRHVAKWVIALLPVGLACESAAAFPDYIPYFNAAAGGARGGLSLLSDSNLDWGQDLTALARWQQAHPQSTLYLCYFGTADPAYYGIRYIRLPGGGPHAGIPLMSAQSPVSPGVIAVSATHLQGTYLPEPLRRFYAPMRDLQPLEVLGGTIYLYDFPTRPPKAQ